MKYGPAQVPPGAKEWQLPLDLPGDAARVVEETVAAASVASNATLETLRLREEEAWLLQVHPGRQMLRVLLRPGKGASFCPESQRRSPIASASQPSGVLLMRMLRRGRRAQSAGGRGTGRSLAVLAVGKAGCRLPGSCGGSLTPRMEGTPRRRSRPASNAKPWPWPFRLNSRRRSLRTDPLPTQLESFQS